MGRLDLGRVIGSSGTVGNDGRPSIVNGRSDNVSTNTITISTYDSSRNPVAWAKRLARFCIRMRFFNRDSTNGTVSAEITSESGTQLVTFHNTRNPVRLTATSMQTGPDTVAYFTVDPYNSRVLAIQRTRSQNPWRYSVVKIQSSIYLTFYYFHNITNSDGSHSAVEGNGVKDVTAVVFTNRRYSQSNPIPVIP